MLFEKVAIIGVGLIGGSFALALKQAQACRQVVGVGRSAANLKLALERGAIDATAPDPAAAARGADFILIASPVAQFEKILESLAPVLEPKTIVSDAGSTKRDVIAAAKKALGRKLAQFVPAHPIAGAEQSGAGAANAELFRGRQVVLTPLPENPSTTIEKVSAAWASCGARIAQMPATEHDAVLAAVSHLPHVLAYALVHDIAGRKNAEQLFSYAAGGFRDFTRIASSHPEMWRDISLANRDRLAGEIEAFEKKLKQVKKLIEKGDGASLEKLFAEAREARNKWIRSS